MSAELVRDVRRAIPDALAHVRGELEGEVDRLIGDLLQAIGPDALTTLLEQTGLSREELLSRLTRELPTAVDKLTPEGRLPTEDEAARLI